MKTQDNIRPLHGGDQAAWTSLWSQYLSFYQTKLPEAVYSSTWHRLLDPGEPVWGAFSIANDQPVGLVHHIFHRTAWSLHDTCYLQDLFVASSVRGQGHGRALIAYVRDAARRNNCERVYWLTHESNAEARALYDRVAAPSGFIQYRLPSANRD